MQFFISSVPKTTTSCDHTCNTTSENPYGVSGQCLAARRSSSPNGTFACNSGFPDMCLCAFLKPAN